MSSTYFDNLIAMVINETKEIIEYQCKMDQEQFTVIMEKDVFKSIENNTDLVGYIMLCVINSKMKIQGITKDSPFCETTIPRVLAVRRILAIYLEEGIIPKTIKHFLRCNKYNDIS